MAKDLYINVVLYRVISNILERLQMSNNAGMVKEIMAQ